MAHERQQEFCMRVKSVFPEYFKGVNVCDIGSLDINGNNHYLFEDYSYMGVDVGRGKNVNVVCSGHIFMPIGLQKYDLVISTECFEHDMYWDKTINNVCENLVRPDGMFLFTCATTGRPEHGTLRSAPTDSPLTSSIGNEWSEYYRNLTQEDIEAAIDLKKYFKIWRFSTDMESCDLYFWGIKN
jgi:SAM-dependent methyltransferase